MMDASTVNMALDFVGSSGIVLSNEQKAGLQTSLTILQNEQKYSKVFFWGCIKGTKSDYYLCQGVGKDEMSDRKTHYSNDCVNWVLLPPAVPENREKAQMFKGRFTGDISYEFEHVEIRQVPGEGDEMHEEEETINMKEEDRLSAVVAEIDQNTVIVPRGAFLRLTTGQIVTNKSFSGLDLDQAAHHHNYLHFREPHAGYYKAAADSGEERARLDKAIDFLDSIEADVPRHAWSIQTDYTAGQAVLVKSLLWFGYVFYHVPNTNFFGSVYHGYGEPNVDLPFML